MKFSELAKYLEKLEGTAGRNDMTVILAELFSKTSPEDARLVAYLTQGHLGPAYRSPDFGVADKQMIKAIEKLSNEDIGKIFKETGDLGKTIEKLRVDNGKLKIDHELDIKTVYDRLWEVAESSGEGSQERKMVLIAELLNGLDPVSAKYVVKMVLGKLRSGFSDMTVLDALSWMITGDKKLKKEIEAMYNVRADLGEVAKTLKALKAPKALEPEIGTPVLMAKCERAESAADIWERNGKCAVEYKLDGLRIQAHIKRGQVQLFSRGLENVTSMYPDVVEGLAKQIKGDAIVEGEMIAMETDGRFKTFQETAQRKRKYGIDDKMKEIPLVIYLFEVLMTNGKTVMLEKNEQRRRVLESLVISHSPLDTVRLMNRKIVESVKDIEEFFVEAVAKGTEGIIAKKLDGPYQAGARDFNWIKYKESYDASTLNDTIDAVIMGYDVGQGKRSVFGIGDFLIGVYEPKTDKYLTVAKIGTGLTDAEWRQVKLRIDNEQLKIKPEVYEVNKIMDVDVWCKPKIVVEIKADEITKSPMHTSGLALRFPRLVSWREKKPEDATTVAEMERLFKMQSSK